MIGNDKIPFLEHLPYESSLNLLRKCQKILKPFRMLLAVVPDYTKCGSIDVATAERVIMSQGDHKMLFNSERLYSMIKASGFRHAYELTNLNEVPYLLVANIYDPKPDQWQTAYIALKI